MNSLQPSLDPTPLSALDSAPSATLPPLPVRPLNPRDILDPDLPVTAPILDRSGWDPTLPKSVADARAFDLAFEEESRRRGRPRLMMPQMLEMLCKVIRMHGLSDSAAGAAIGISKYRICRWKADDEAFGLELRRAREEYRSHKLQQLELLTEKDGQPSFRAITWCLRHHFRGDYMMPARMSAKAAAALAAEQAAGADEEEPDLQTKIQKVREEFASERSDLRQHIESLESALKAYAAAFNNQLTQITELASRLTPAAPGEAAEIACSNSTHPSSSFPESPLSPANKLNSQLATAPSGPVQRATAAENMVPELQKLQECKNEVAPLDHTRSGCSSRENPSSPVNQAESGLVTPPSESFRVTAADATAPATTVRTLHQLHALSSEAPNVTATLPESMCPELQKLHEPVCRRPNVVCA